MVATNPQTQVITKSIRYTVAGSKGTTWIVSVDPTDQVMHCNCPDHEYRQRECKHMTAVREGRAGKPIIRCTVRPARPAIHAALRWTASELEV